MPIASRALSRASGYTKPLSRQFVAALVAGWLMLAHGGLAHASQEALDAVAKLLEQGKATQAAKQAEDYLKKDPGDVQMRFMQGVIAVEQGQNDRAIEIFSALTRNYPDMPEPYNNLAVLYAAQGQERKASETLQQAIRTNPSYATAHENLGDLYALMASEAYAKALQLGDGHRAAPKLALIRQISGKAAAPAFDALTAKASTPSPTLTPTPVPRHDVVAQAQPALPDAQNARPRQEPPPERVPASPPPAQQPTAQPPEKAAASPTPAVAATAAVEVETAINAWAAAWAKQDMGRYLGAYSKKFAPADGGSLAQWKETRRQRIVGKPPITVSLRDIQVTVEADKATARFRQSYASGALKTSTRKTLKLQREDGHWRITHEGTGV